MPIYNVEQYIERALLSALNQTYQNLEILIVDDLGHDNSMNIVYQLKHTHPRGNCIRIITHKKNLGLGGTRNTAIESAQGKYLYFMDSDDAIVPDCIETLYNIISQEKVDFVAAGINQIDENENSLKITNYPNITRKGKLCMAQYFYEEKCRSRFTMFGAHSPPTRRPSLLFSDVADSIRWTFMSCSALSGSCANSALSRARCSSRLGLVLMSKNES